MNVRNPLRPRPFTVGAIVAAILIGIVIAAYLAPPIAVNVAGEATLVVGQERPTRPATEGGRATSIVDGWYAAPLNRPIISHWNAPVGPDGNWAELRFTQPRSLAETTIFWGVGEVAPRAFTVDADFGGGFESIAAYQGPGAEAVVIDLPPRPIQALRVNIELGYESTQSAHWVEWLVFEEQPALSVLLFEGVAPLVRRLLVALAFLAVILVPGFTIARRLPGRLTRDASFVVGIPIALILLGALSALVLWRAWPAWPPLIILGAIAVYGVGHPSTRRDLARVDRRMLAIAAAGMLLHVLVWHLFDTIAPRHGGDTLYPLEVARVFMSQTPFDTPDLRDALWGYAVGFRTPLLSLLVGPFLGAFGNDVTTYLTLIYAASGLFYVAAYAVMRQHVGRAAAGLGGVFLVLNPALLRWTEQVPNKMLAQTLVLVGLYIVARATTRRPGAAALGAGAVLGLAYVTHNSALLGILAAVVYAIVRARTLPTRLRSLAVMIPAALAALGWAAWQRVFDVPSDIAGQVLLGPATNGDGQGTLATAVGRALATPLTEHILVRLQGLGSVFVWDPANTRLDQALTSPAMLQTLVPSAGVVLFVLACAGFLVAPRRARLALLVLTVVPAVAVIGVMSRASPANPFIGLSFAYASIFGGLAAVFVLTLGKARRLRSLALLLVAVEFVVQAFIVWGASLFANPQTLESLVALGTLLAVIAVVARRLLGLSRAGAADDPLRTGDARGRRRDGPPRLALSKRGSAGGRGGA